jgi:heptosyltransferase-2
MIRDTAGLNFLKNRTVREDDTLHNVEENLRLLDFLGITPKKDYPLDFFPTDEERLFAQQWIKEKGMEGRMLIGMHPGASSFKNHGRKRWAGASFAALIGMLSTEFKESVTLLFGGAEEADLKSTVAASVRDRKSVLPVESLSLRQSAVLMMSCSLFISNDSGLMHMAAAARVPVVAIFGPTNPVWVRPWGVRHRVIRTGISCRPCFRYSPKPMHCDANRDFVCMREITAEQVYKACLDLLGEST